MRHTTARFVVVVSASVMVTSVLFWASPSGADRTPPPPPPLPHINFTARTNADCSTTIEMVNPGGPVPSDLFYANAIITRRIDGAFVAPLLLKDIDPRAILRVPGATVTFTNPPEIRAYNEANFEIYPDSYQGTQGINGINWGVIGPCRGGRPKGDVGIEDIVLDSQCRIVTKIRNYGPNDNLPMVLDVRLEYVDPAYQKPHSDGVTVTQTNALVKVGGVVAATAPYAKLPGPSPNAPIVVVSASINPWPSVDSNPSNNKLVKSVQCTMPQMVHPPPGAARLEP